MAFTLWGINLPTIPTSLAYGDRFILVDRLLLFISKKLKNQRRDRKVKPFDRDPPADEKPNLNHCKASYRNQCNFPALFS